MPSPTRPSAGFTIHSSDVRHGASRGSRVSGSSARHVGSGVRSASHTSGNRLLCVENRRRGVAERRLRAREQQRPAGPRRQFAQPFGRERTAPRDRAGPATTRPTAPRGHRATADGSGSRGARSRRPPRAAARRTSSSAGRRCRRWRARSATVPRAPRARRERAGVRAGRIADRRSPTHSAAPISRRQPGRLVQAARHVAVRFGNPPAVGREMKIEPDQPRGVGGRARRRRAPQRAADARAAARATRCSSGRCDDLALRPRASPRPALPRCCTTSSHARA